MKAFITTKVKSPIKLLKAKSAYEFFCVDTNSSYFDIQISDSELISSQEEKFDEKPKELFLNDVDVDANLGLIAYGINDTKDAALWSVKHKRELIKLSWHKGKIESVCFDPKMRYLATGGQDGLVFLWSIKNGKLSGRLQSHSDFISTIAFSSKGNWIATSSYDRRIYVTNISSMKSCNKLIGASSAAIYISFLSDFRLLSVHKDGSIIIWNYLDSNVINRPIKALNNITTALVIDNEKFLIVGTKDKKIAIYDLRSYEKITDSFITLSSAPTALLYIKSSNFIVVSEQNSDISVFKIDYEIIKKLMKEKDYGTVLNIYDENPLLKDEKIVQFIEEEWKKSFENALMLIQKKDTQNVSKIFSFFDANGKKRVQIQKLLKDFKDYDKFEQLFKAKKFVPFYSMAFGADSLQQTQYFKKVESFWESLFEKAKKLLFENKDEDGAKKVLAPFSTIPQKNIIIANLLKDYQAYGLMLQLISQNEAKAIFNLVERKAFLKTTKEFLEFQNTAYLKFEALKEQLSSKNYLLAIKNSHELLDYPDFAEEIKQIQARADIYFAFERELKDKNIVKILKMIERYPYLEDMESANPYIEKWQNSVYEAEKSAIKGDVKGVIKTLGAFIKNNLYYDKISEILALCYAMQINKALIQKDISSEDLIKAVDRYLAYFGTNEHYKVIIEKMISKGINIEESTSEQSGLWDLNSLVINIIK